MRPRLTSAQAGVCAVGLILVLILLAPEARVSKIVIALAASIGTVAAILFAMTFLAKARVLIGRSKLRYRYVRRYTGAVAALGLSLVVAQRISIAGWAGSSAPSNSETRFAADRLKILADLKARRFDALDKELRTYQAQAEQNIGMEGNAVFAFEAFSNTERYLGPLLDEWEKKLPDSYVPHLAKAEYLAASGWKARGDQLASDVSKEQIARMNDWFAQCATEVKEVTSRDKRVAEAYAVLIGAAKTSAGPELVAKISSEGLAEVPASFAIRRALIISLEPRWGGSYDAMEKFANDSDSMTSANPEIAVLKGFADYMRAATLIWNEDYAGAIPIYTRAIAEGGDYYMFYRGRGSALQHLGRSAAALVDLKRADQLEPQSAETLVLMAYALVYLGRTSEARMELDIAARLAEPDEDAQRLRDQLAHTAD